MIVYDTTHERVDLEKLAALFRSVDWEKKTRDRDQLAAAVAGSRWVVTAWDGGELVGFCRAFSDGALGAYVNSVCVRPDYQRRGIGSELVRRIMADRDQIAFVLHADARVHPFYKSLGFEDAPEMLRRPRSH